MSDLTFRSSGDYADFFDHESRLIPAAWPEFMLQDPVAHERFPLVYRMYPDFQEMALVDGQPAAILNWVPIPDVESEDLPDEGWDWAITVATDEARTATRTAAGLQIVIDPAFRGRGLARLLVERMQERAAAAGIERVYAPVRPPGKAEYPLVPMAAYAGWTRRDGLPFDPWIRVHVALGGEILQPCERAMRITGPVRDWEGWTGLTFPGSGLHLVPGALVPVHIDLEADLGEYVEPNLWMMHRVG